LNELIITNVKFLYFALKSMENIDYECNIKLSSDGMEIQGIGPSRVSLFKFVLGKLGDDYEDFGMDLTDLGKILERIKNAKEAKISYDSKTRRIKIKSKIKNKTKTFYLSEITAESAKFPMDMLLSQPYEVTFEMLTKDIVSILKDGEIYSERVTIGIKDGMLSFKSMGTIGSSFIQLEDRTYNRDFGTEYGVLHLLSKIDRMQSFQVNLVLGENIPIYFNYEFDNGYLKVFIAPRVEEDDDF